MHLAAKQARQASAELEGAVPSCSLFPGGYAGLEPIEGRARQPVRPGAPTCITVRGPCRPCRELLETIRRACPALDRRLRGAEFLWSRPLAVAAIPYGHVASADDGLWRVGDQAAVIPSFAGDGLGIALHSARTPASDGLSGRAESAAAFQRALLAIDLRPRVKGAALLSHAFWCSPGLSSWRWSATCHDCGPCLLFRYPAARRTLTRIPRKALARASAAQARASSPWHSWV